MEILMRIPRQKYAYLEANVEEGDTVESVEKRIQEMIPLLDKYSTTDLEVVLDDRKCPKCGGRLFEQIGVSDKTNKPYHRIKCEFSGCDHVQWINVKGKNG